MTLTDELAKTREPRVAQLLEQAVLARLGTANPKTMQPHITLVWFAWDGESVFISAFSSTRKVKDLLRNRRCAVLIEPQDPTAGGLQAVLFEGECEVIAEQPYVAQKAEWIYTRYMGVEGVKAPEPQSWMVDPENRIIRLKPSKVYVW